MRDKSIRILNIIKDFFIYKWFYLIKQDKNKNIAFNLVYSNCAVLCKGESLTAFLKVENKFDCLILINFDKTFKKFPLIFEKIGNTPVIILTSRDEPILKFRQRKNLNIIKVYSRLSAPNLKEFNQLRIRRRLEGYGLQVNSLFNIVDANIIKDKLRNTGLLGVYFASIYFKNISIFGLDFYTGPYFTKTPGKLPTIYDKEKGKILKSNEITMEFSKTFIDICSSFPANYYTIHTYFNNWKTSCSNLQTKTLSEFGET
jgi:hypothetical protein